MLDDESTVVVRRGIEFAIDFDKIDLVTFLEGPDSNLAEVAAFVLGERVSRRGQTDDDDVELTALCTVASHHDDALCREAAVAALGAISEHLDEGAPQREATKLILWAALEDKATIRRRAVIALSTFDDPESAVLVRAAREDRDTQVRRIATALSDEDRRDDESDTDQRR
ncbi:MAG: HEAT repeat domain-containing protein [Acidobacteria bacterium]|nr:HEAT repeat domain-containing protein [Acidobacteriota bacterium]